jgi:hypothetical protein
MCPFSNHTFFVSVTACFYAGHVHNLRTAFIPMLFKSRNRIQIKSKCKNSMFFSNGAFVFCVSLILCTGKWIKLCSCIQTCNFST